MKVRVAKGKRKMCTICYGVKIWVNRIFWNKPGARNDRKKKLALLLITVIVRPVMK